MKEILIVIGFIMSMYGLVLIKLIIPNTLDYSITGFLACLLLNLGGLIMGTYLGIMAMRNNWK
jgi:hypothetical protein